MAKKQVENAETLPTKPKEKAKEFKKKVCPISQDLFLKEARPLLVEIGDQKVVLGLKMFTSGSFGWHATGKTAIEVGGIPVNVQLNLIATVIGSKNIT